MYIMTGIVLLLPNVLLGLYIPKLLGVWDYDLSDLSQLSGGNSSAKGRL